MPGTSASGWRIPLDADPLADTALAVRNLVTDIEAAWKTWAPTLTNFAGTVNLARYRRQGKSMEIQLHATLTAAPTGTMLITPPVPARPGGAGIELVVGSAAATLAGLFRVGAVRLEATGANPRLFIHSDNTGFGWDATHPATWAAGHLLTIRASYEAS